MPCRGWAEALLFPAAPDGPFAGTGSVLRSQAAAKINKADVDAAANILVWQCMATGPFFR
jgi:hypothetical protein